MPEGGSSMRLYLIPAAAAALAACSAVNPIQQDQPMLLAQGDGIAAVSFNTNDGLSQVQFEPAGAGGKELDIPSVPAGSNMYLFEAPAGRYCLQRFYLGRFLVSQQSGALGCFVVPAGQVGFSGIYVPTPHQDGVEVNQDLDAQRERDSLREHYPKVAAQFLQPEPAQATRAAAAPSAGLQPLTSPAPAQPAPAQSHPVVGGEQLSTWSTDHDDHLAQDIYVRNNTQWPMKLVQFELYDCINIKQECKLTTIDFKLKPHETRMFMTVEPADAQGAWAYRFHYLYGFDTLPAPPAKKKK